MAQLEPEQVALIATLALIDHDWWLETNGSALCERCGQRVNVGDEFGELAPLVSSMLSHANECRG